MNQLKQQITDLAKDNLIDEGVVYASSCLRIEYTYNILPEIRELLLDYQKTISSHLCFEDFKKELENLAEYYPLPKGCLFAGFVEIGNTYLSHAGKSKSYHLNLKE